MITKFKVTLLLVALTILGAVYVPVSATDGPLTSLFGLLGRTDENGYLLISAGTPGGVDGPLTPLGNLRGRTDENGYLRVACSDCGGGGGAPTTATYITQTANGSLSAEQALGALATGCLSSTTTTGVVASRTLTGTANEIDVANGTCAGTPTWTLSATMDLGGKTSFEIPNGASPTVDAFGELAGDNDLWASGRGAPVFFDGTAATALVNVLVSDTPTNGQVPTWNTGGTITWETPAAGSFDSTTVDATTWSDGANASNIWTFDVSGTDTTWTFGSANTITSGSLDLVTDGVRLSGASGVLTLLGLGAGADESLTVDLDSSAGSAVFGGAASFDFSGRIRALATIVGDELGLEVVNLSDTALASVSLFIATSGDSATGDASMTWVVHGDGANEAAATMVVDGAGGATPDFTITTPGNLVLAGGVTPASTGTRYLCIDTTGVVQSSSSACSGT